MLKDHLESAPAAAHLGITRATFYNLRGTPDFPEPAYVGRTPIWPIRGLDQWRTKHRARKRADKAQAGTSASRARE